MSDFSHFRDYWTRLTDSMQDWGADETFHMAPPIDPDVLQSTCADLQITLPAELADFYLTCSAHLLLMWVSAKKCLEIDDENCDGSIFEMSADHDALERLLSRRENVREEYGDTVPNANGQYEYELDSMFPFLYCNGHVFFCEHDRGRIFSHSFDRGDIEFLPLADSLLEFMTTWTKLGCVGPEPYILSTFYDFDGRKLSADTPNALQLREMLDITGLFD